MKPLALKPESQQSQPEPQKVTLEMVEQIANKTATKAADAAAVKAAQRVSDEAMESFNKFQQQNNQQNQQNQQPQQYQDTDIQYENDGGYSIDTKTEKSLMRRLLDQTLQKALDPPPPSPIESAINQVMTQVSTGIAEKMLGNVGGGVQVATKHGIIGDILNSPFGANFGTSFGQSLPQIIQSLTGAIGQQKAQELASAATKAMSQPQGEQNNVTPQDSNVEKQKDMVLALDSNNPEHVTQYAAAMGLSIGAAKEMLQNHQNDILKSRKSLLGGTDANTNTTSNNEITQALTVLIQEMTGMKQTISALQNEIVTIKTKKSDVNEVQSQPEVQESSIHDKWTDEDEDLKIDRQQVGSQQKSVTLFQSPIKVDLDEIKGNVNSFFEETPKDTKIEPEESVLEEVVDNEGKSTFKMSDNKEKPKEQPKKITEIPKEQPKKETVVSIETEQDKKKESSSAELIEENKSQPSEEQKIEEQTPKEHMIKKKIIRKPIPISKDESNISSHVTERYDINNNLITLEDNIK